MKINFLDVWFPPINLWSKPIKMKPTQPEEEFRDEPITKPHLSAEHQYWWKKGYQQAVKDMQVKLDEMQSKRQQDLKR